MNYILVGIAGFLIIHLCDPVAIKRIPVVKTIVWVAGSGLLVYALVMISLWPDRLSLPIWSTWLGWATEISSAMSLWLTRMLILLSEKALFPTEL
jgi:hypothetical protein